MCKPMVSIICFVYNHEKYLREALEGFVMQKTSFSIEVIIHDDASTDSSALIIKDYEKKYPEIIKPIYQKINQHSLEKGRVSKNCYSKAKGKYIALCEGDDYWTDPLKLQKQVDFLEANKQYGAVTNNALVLNDNGETYIFGRKKSRIIKDEEIIRCRQFATASLVFRNNTILPEEIKSLIAGDTPLMLSINKKAPIYYINEVTSVYRYGAHGITAKWNDDNHKMKLIKFHLFINKYTNYKYSTIIKKKILSIDRDYSGINNLERFILNKMDYIDSFIYILFIKIFRVKRTKFFDISFYPFYKKIYFRIFS